jgi:hypothetical protein
MSAPSTHPQIGSHHNRYRKMMQMILRLTLFYQLNPSFLIILLALISEENIVGVAVWSVF